MGELYRLVLEVDAPRFGEPMKEMNIAFWGPLGEVAKENYTQKTHRLQTAKEKLSMGDAWAWQ